MWDGCKHLQHQRRSDAGTRLKLSGTGPQPTLQQDEDHIYTEGLFSGLLQKLIKAAPEASSLLPTLLKSPPRSDSLTLLFYEEDVSV